MFVSKHVVSLTVVTANLSSSLFRYLVEAITHHTPLLTTLTIDKYLSLLFFAKNLDEVNFPDKLLCIYLMLKQLCLKAR